MNTLPFPSDRIFKVLLTVIVAAALFFTGFAASALAPSLTAPARSLAGSGLPAVVPGGKMSTLNFQNAMRKLWEEHVTWTRLFIVSVAADLPDKGVTAQRLLQNQADIGNAVRTFYGDAAADQLTALLKDHILIAADLLAAVKAGDSAAAKAASDKWYANANQIAAFLNSANPKNWPLAALQAEMKMHLDLTLQEAADRLNGKFSADIQDYDRIENHILGMADILSAGIIDQFPNRFVK